MKRDVTLKGECGVLAFFLKLSTCNKINSRNRRRGKPSSLQIKVPTWKTCNRMQSAAVADAQFAKIEMWNKPKREN